MNRGGLILLLAIFGVGAYLLFTNGGALLGMASSALVESIATAIATAEGWYVQGSIPQQANNPGDLADPNFSLNLSGDTGQRIGSAGIVVFDSAQSGWQALYNQVNLMLSGNSGVYSPSMTIAQVGQIYSGGDPNWAANVAKALGVSTTTTLAELNA